LKLKVLVLLAHFAVGLPDSALEEYGQMAMPMFNSIELDTDITAELAE